MQPKVSVILRTYNMGSTLERAMNSVLSQTYTNFELIIVDDGSTDNTQSVLDKYSTISGVKTHRYQKNQGRPVSANKGIQLSSGDYITFLDADDILTEDSLEVRVNYLEANHQKDAVFTRSIYFNRRGQEWLSKELSPFKDQKELALLFFTSLRSPFDLASLMYRKSIFDRIGLMDPKQKRTHDIDYFVRLAHSSFSVGYTPKPLYKVDVSSHNNLARVKNRYQSLLNRMRTIRNHLPPPKGVLYLRCLINESLKLFYEIFSQNMGYFQR